MIVSHLIREQLREHALQLGFSHFGVVADVPAPGYERLKEWVSRGYAGSMEYIPERIDAYKSPQSVMAGCKSIVMMAMPYQSHAYTKPSKTHSSVVNKNNPATEGAIGSYASGNADYHDLIRQRLNQLSEKMQALCPGSLSRGVVDTAPLMERDYAMLAGLGWIGKNTLLLNREIGSYFFLAALLTDVELSTDAGFESNHCGTCTACLDACPTNAFPEPHVLNASRCISYLTIEHRGEIAPELCDQMQNWVFGCDVCQIVCPWNRKRSPSVISPLQHQDMELKTSLQHWLSIDELEFRRLYRKTPFWRTKLQGMRRNALIAAANSNRQDLRPMMERYLESENPVLRATSRWSIAKLDTLLNVKPQEIR